MRTRISLLAVSALIVLFHCNRSKGANNNTNPPVDPPVIPPAVNEVDFWLTKGDQSVLLQKQTTVLAFGTSSNTNPNIEVDSTKTFQPIDGFGYTLTGGSAQLINAMGPAPKANLLQELFGNTANSIGVSFLRISIGASDLNAAPFSYDDMPAGQTDLTLANFTLDNDRSSGTV